MTDETDRGEIHLGDLARALAALKWENDDQAKAIAACLGFALHTSPKPKPPVEIYDRQRYPSGERTPEQPPPERPLFVPPAPEAVPPLPANHLAGRIQPLPERAPAAPDDSAWLQEGDALYSAEEQTAVARQPLFLERTSRHIVSAALGTLRSGAEIDEAKLISAICRREPIPELPRRPEATLELGCQLLLDYSASMVPFWEDLNGLIGQVGEVMGEGNTRVYSFDTRPTEAVCWTPEGEREPWQPEGRPVLAATDFGIQGRSGRAQPDSAWRIFAERCRQAGVPLVILVPWPRARWPLDLGGCPELVHWNAHTSASTIRKKIGLGHRIG